MKEFGYYIYQGNTSWPVAGFAMESDARILIAQLRKRWPGTPFRLIDSNGNAL
jgi:hypothetical protein